MNAGLRRFDVKALWLCIILYCFYFYHFPGAVSINASICLIKGYLIDVLSIKYIYSGLHFTVFHCSILL